MTFLDCKLVFVATIAPSNATSFECCFTASLALCATALTTHLDTALLIRIAARFMIGAARSKTGTATRNNDITVHFLGESTIKAPICT